MKIIRKSEINKEFFILLIFYFITSGVLVAFSRVLAYALIAIFAGYQTKKFYESLESDRIAGCQKQGKAYIKPNLAYRLFEITGMFIAIWILISILFRIIAFLVYPFVVVIASFFKG